MEAPKVLWVKRGTVSSSGCSGSGVVSALKEGGLAGSLASGLGSDARRPSGPNHLLPLSSPSVWHSRRILECRN